MHTKKPTTNSLKKAQETQPTKNTSAPLEGVIILDEKFKCVHSSGLSTVLFSSIFDDDKFDNFLSHALVNDIFQHAITEAIQNESSVEGSAFLEDYGHWISYKITPLHGATHIHLKSTNKPSLKTFAQDFNLEGIKFLNQFPLGILVFDPVPKKFVYANQKICQMTGYSLVEFQEMSPVDIHPREALAKVSAAYKALSEGKILAPRNLTVIKKDGQTFTANIDITNLSVDGQMINMAIISDVSQEVIVPSALAFQNKFSDAVVKALPDLFFLLDFDGGIVEAKAGMAIDFLLPYDQFIGKNIAEVLDKAIVKKAFKGIQSIRKGAQLYTFEYPMVLHGKVLHFEARMMVFEEDYVLTTIRDITAIKTLNDHLDKSEAQFVFLFDHMTQGVLFANQEGVIENANVAAQKLLGLSLAELKGNKPLPEGWSTISRTGKAISYFELLKTGAVVENQVIGILHPGSAQTIWVLVSVIPQYRKNSKKPHGVFSTFTDITLLIQEQLEKQENALRFKKLVQNLPGVTYITKYDGKFNIEYLSDSVKDFIGFESDQIIQEAPSFASLCHPEDLLHIYATVEDAITNKTPFKLSFRIRSKADQWLWIEAYGEAVFEKDSLQYLIGYMNDITESKEAFFALKASEERLRNIVNTDTHYVIRTNMAGEYTYYNQKFEKTFKHCLDISNNVLASVCEYHHDIVRETVFKCIQNPGEIFTIAIDKPGVDQRVLHTLWEFIYLTDENQEHSEMQCVGLDITVQKAAVNDLKLQAEMQELLMEISASFISLPLAQLDLAINESLAKLGAFIKADRFYIFEYDFDKQLCHNTYEWCAISITPEIDNLQNIPIDGIPAWTTKHKAGKIMEVKDVQSLPAGSSLRNILEPQGIKSLVTIPLMRGTDCIGFLGLDYVHAIHEASAIEERMLKLFSQMLVNVYDRLTNLYEIKSNKQFLKDLIESSPSMIYVKDTEGHYKMVNKTWLQSMGLKKNKVIGKNARDLFPEALAQTIIKNDAHVVHTGQAIEVEEEKSEGGAVRYFLTAKFPTYDSKGHIIGSAGISTEITARKKIEKALIESEQRFKTIFENNASVMYLFDPETKDIIDVNDSAVAYYGYSKEEFLTKKLYDINKSAIDFDEKINIVKSRKRNHFIFVHQKADGSKRDVEVFSSLINVNGRPMISAIVHDITDRNIYLKTIENQNKKFKEIAWMQSHVVRAPLSRMMGLMMMLEHNSPGAFGSLENLIKSIVDSAKELDQIIIQISKKAEKIPQIELSNPLEHIAINSNLTSFEVLLVDDDRMIQIIHKHQFVRKGIHQKPSVFAHGKLALDYIKSHARKDKCMVIMLDLNMPVMHGWDFLEALQTFDYPGIIKVVVVTSSVSKEDQEQAFMYPEVIDYLIKPLTDKALETLANSPQLKFYLGLKQE